MAYEQKDGYVSIFKNNKPTSDRSPGYTGTAKYKGEELVIALWLHEGKNGKYFSGTIQPKRVSEPAQEEPPHEEPPQDEIPF